MHLLSYFPCCALYRLRLWKFYVFIPCSLFYVSELALLKDCPSPSHLPFLFFVQLPFPVPIGTRACYLFSHRVHVHCVCIINFIPNIFILNNYIICFPLLISSLSLWMSHLHQLLGLMCVCLIGFFAWASGIPDKGLRTGDIGHPWSTGEMEESVVRAASFLNESITYREEPIKEPFTAGSPLWAFCIVCAQGIALWFQLPHLWILPQWAGLTSQRWY